LDIALDLYHKCLNLGHGYKVKKSPNECLSAIEKYLKEFEYKYLKNQRPFNIEHSIPVIFRENLDFKKRTEFNSYAKYQLRVAFQWFKLIVTEIRKNKKITLKNLLKFKNYIIDFLHDVSYFIDFFEQKTDPSFHFLNGSKYYGQETVFIYHNARNSYWASLSNDNNVDHKGNQSSSCYFLRQSLELKFRRILGVNDVTDINGKSARIKHEYFPEFINRNIEHFSLSGSKITNLLKIYKWTNTTIHTSMVPFIWELWFAFEYCDNFMLPKPAVLGQNWSIYNSVTISDINSLIQKLYVDFSSLYNANGLWCFHMFQPQAELASS